MSSAGEPLDILAIAPHPDDAEIGCGGLLALSSAGGRRCGILDLTEGELGSQGSVEERYQEAEAAKSALGLVYRGNALLPDGKLNEQEESQLRTLVAEIRKLRPRLLLAPYREARHPDHAAASALASRAAFFAALKNYAPELGQRHQVQHLLYYAIRRTFRPSFVTDVTAVYESKRAAIRCFSSQVTRSAAEQFSAEDPGPLISSPLSLSSIEARDRFYGAQIGVEYGEAFALRTVLAVPNPVAHFEQAPLSGALLFDAEW